MFDLTAGSQQPNELRYSDEASATLQCIFDVQQNLNAYTTTGENKQGGKYKYRKHVDLNEDLKPYLAKHKCVIIPNAVRFYAKSGWAKIQGAKDAAPKDKLVTITYADVSVTLVNVANPKDWVKAHSFGVKVDQVSDKALGAQTIGTRYAIMALFNIPSSGDEDPDSNEGDVRRFDMFAPQPAQGGQGLSNLFGGSII